MKITAAQNELLTAIKAGTITSAYGRKTRTAEALVSKGLITALRIYTAPEGAQYGQHRVRKNDTGSVSYCQMVAV